MWVTRFHPRRKSPSGLTFQPELPQRIRYHNDGTTDVDVVIVRDGKNLKGRVLGTFAKTLKAIEARNYGVGAGKEA